MTSDDRGFGPDDMGDDEQQSEVSQYERYIEDPPERELDVAEDDDSDANEAYDWAARHPEAVGHDGRLEDHGDDEDDLAVEPAERAAVHERRNP